MLLPHSAYKFETSLEIYRCEKEEVDVKDWLSGEVEIRELDKSDISEGEVEIRELDKSDISEGDRYLHITREVCNGSLENKPL